MKQYRVAILGASGAVGQEMMKILAERKFPVGELHLLASARSSGHRLARMRESCSFSYANPHVNFQGL